MKKIGFIDYYLDNWHANNYVSMIRDASEGRIEVCYAWGMIDKEGGLTSSQWAEKYGVELLGSIEEVVEKSDYLVVLAPNNPEVHEELTELVLRSGKLTYVDKTFAPSKAAAERMFANAEAHGTPFFSTSALRFSDELAEIDKDSVYTLYSRGGGTYTMYSIHQIEPMVVLLGSDPKRVMFTGDETHPAMIVEFANGKRAHIYQGDWPAFELATVDQNNKFQAREVKSDFFMNFIRQVVRFFDTGVVPVPKEQTVAVAAIRAAGFEAMKTPFTWVEL